MRLPHASARLPPLSGFLAGADEGAEGDEAGLKAPPGRGNAHGRRRVGIGTPKNGGFPFGLPLNQAEMGTFSITLTHTRTWVCLLIGSGANVIEITQLAGFKENPTANSPRYLRRLTRCGLL